IGSLTVRGMSRTEPSVRIVFYTMLLATVLSGLVCPFVRVTPSWGHTLILVGVGIAGGTAPPLMKQAYPFAPPAAVAPVIYTSMVWAFLFGFFLWGDVPGTAVLIGAAVVIASGLYILHREPRRRAAAARAAPRSSG